MQKVVEPVMLKVPEQWVIHANQIKLAKEKPIGSGNFADVYRGTFTKKNKQKIAAIKIIRKNERKTKEETVTITEEELTCLAEMNNEAMIMSLLKHQNVTEFYGISSEQMVMIVMEYCAGGSLDVHLQLQKGAITTCERVQYMVEISSGMRYLEKKKVIHRDLAARNILISCRGHLKVADFGLSLSPNVTNAKNNARNVPVRWMAPETLKANAEFSTKSDVWSFGVVCYEIFNYGVKPWPEKPVKWVATQIRKNRMTKMPTRMPRTLRELVTTCHNPKPGERPTFSRLNGHLIYMQNIRFGPPASEKFTLNKPKQVVRTKLVEADLTDTLLIELEHISKAADKRTETLMHTVSTAQDREISLRSVRDLPTPGAPAGTSNFLLKKTSSEALNENDEDNKEKDDEKTLVVTKETIEEMDPTDREK
ncbi:hypothetical protein L596_030596 [Steinernema carpocapsae]|uniref:Protein kinase domain-containing protein n=1 Tax=Steinernema carpocapsae TaxID=34508 RepID=A0A4U5LPU1_STECR|nr:hypothetical protein L596_030596 [Steinernema carpocapsae]